MFPERHQTVSAVCCCMLRQQIGGGSFGRRVLRRESCCRFRRNSSLGVFRGECDQEKLQWPSAMQLGWYSGRGRHSQSKPPKAVPAPKKLQHEALDGLQHFLATIQILRKIFLGVKVGSQMHQPSGAIRDLTVLRLKPMTSYRVGP